MAIEVPHFILDDILGKPKNRIERLGVELEGAWKNLPGGVRLEHDGSVFRNTALSPGWQKGELPIGPIQPAALEKFMRKYYPHKVDATCGMHVHMSFENLYQYSALETIEYQESIIYYLTLWAKEEAFPKEHHIWKRLGGKSEFCQKKFWPDLQAAARVKDHDQNRDGHRYTIVNYCGRQLTIEIRVLPMMVTVEQAIKAIRHVLDITNACLMVCAKREPRIKNRLELPNGEIYEEYIEEKL